MKMTFLGTGTSRGIPVVGCRCEVCRSSCPKNKRLRCSLLVEGRDSVIVIDTSADFRQQMLRSGTERLDAVIFTHYHADHVLGLDDVFPYTARSGRALPIFASPRTLEELGQTFRHLFHHRPHRGGIARLDPIAIDEQAFRIGEIEILPIPLLHGNLEIFGYRIGNLAYLTDVSEIPETSYKRLQNLRYLAIDGLRFRPHPTHFNIEEAVDVAQRIGAEQTYLIHMSHEVDHEKTDRGLPEGIALGYDGLQLDVAGEGTYSCR